MTDAQNQPAGFVQHHLWSDRLQPLEAALAGVPVIAADVTGAKDTVIEGETGYLVNPDDQADVLAKAFDRLGIEQPVVVGHSFGTMVTMALARPGAAMMYPAPTFVMLEMTIVFDFGSSAMSTSTPC